MKIWEMITKVAEAKRAHIIFLSLTWKPSEAVLEMDPENLND